MSFAEGYTLYRLMSVLVSASRFPTIESSNKVLATTPNDDNRLERLMCPPFCRLPGVLKCPLFKSLVSTNSISIAPTAVTNRRMRRKLLYSVLAYSRNNV